MPCVLPTLELQPALARAVGERADAAVKEVAVAVENDLLDLFLEALLRDECSHHLRRVALLDAFDRATDLRRERGGGHDRPRLAVVDHLGIDVLEAPIHGQSRPLHGPLHTAPDPLLASDPLIDLL